MRRFRRLIPGVDPKLLIKDAGKVMPDPARRTFLRGAASLGALTMLTGCDVVDSFSAEKVLRKISEFNDGAQALLFDPNQLAPTYPESAITKPFPFNAYYPLEDAPEVDAQGLTSSKSAGWSTTRGHGRWRSFTRCRRRSRSRGISASRAGARSEAGPACACREFLRRIGADTKAKYVWFQCAEGYSNTIDMASALHPQTQLTFKFGDEILPRAYGFPMKCRIPTKLGFKNPKYIVAMHVTNKDLGGYWENQGYNWFSGL